MSFSSSTSDHIVSLLVPDWMWGLDEDHMVKDSFIQIRQWLCWYKWEYILKNVSEVISVLSFKGMTLSFLLWIVESPCCVFRTVRGWDYVRWPFNKHKMRKTVSLRRGSTASPVMDRAVLRTGLSLSNREDKTNWYRRQIHSEELMQNSHHLLSVYPMFANKIDNLVPILHVLKTNQQTRLTEEK